MPITVDFWATTAQVIPALLLSFLVALRPEKRVKQRPTVLRLGYVTGQTVSLTLAVVAEFLALDGLLGDGSAWAARLVVLAIGALASWTILGVALWSALRFFPEHGPEQEITTPEQARQAARELVAVLPHLLHLVIATGITLLPVAASIWLATRI